MDEDGRLPPAGHGLIDLRSDTVTQPTPAMRRAMAEAEVGDDVYREDPTVNHLQEIAAERFGKEAALLVLSGTMGNLVSLLTHCGRGEEVILGDRCHTFMFEQGGTSGVGGIHPHPISDGTDAHWDLDALEAAIRPDDEHVPRTKVICLENTHNAAGGRVLSPEYVAAISEVSSRHRLKLHVDGARIFNAAVAQGVPVADLARDADSLTFCLTKGLACPVGSIIVGDADFIVEARRNRKILGGGMRQAGVFAAAGIVALNEMVERLSEDHANAHRLAEGLADLRGIAVDTSAVETNIVFIEIESRDVDPVALASRLREHGVVIGAARGNRIRLVTHYGVEAADIERTLMAFDKALAGD
jgi:threonine aldolase